MRADDACGPSGVERILLESIERELTVISETEHRLRRKREILRHCATQLRIGRSCHAIEALLAEHGIVC